MGGTVGGTCGLVRDQALGGAGLAMLGVTLGVLHAVTQDVQAGAVLVGSDGIGQSRTFQFVGAPGIAPVAVPVCALANTVARRGRRKPAS